MTRSQRGDDPPADPSAQVPPDRLAIVAQTESQGGDRVLGIVSIVTVLVLLTGVLQVSLMSFCVVVVFKRPKCDEGACLRVSLHYPIQNH
jgi:hypothetical protein